MSPAERLRTFAEQNKVKSGPKCKVCSLPPDLRAALVAERTRGTSYAVLAGWLRTEGHVMKSGTVGSHLREHERG